MSSENQQDFIQNNKIFMNDKNENSFSRLKSDNFNLDKSNKFRYKRNYGNLQSIDNQENPHLPIKKFKNDKNNASDFDNSLMRLYEYKRANVINSNTYPTDIEMEDSHSNYSHSNYK